MKFKSKVTAIALSAAMTFGCVSMTACKNDNAHGVDPRIYAVYTAYSESGGTLTYEEWYAQLLETAKGMKGDQGEKGDQGPQGEKGEQGEQGPQGNDGSSFLHGKGVPTADTKGKAGDLYLDTETWNVYEMTESGWNMQPIGNLNGDVTNETYGSFWLRCHDYKTMPVGAFNAITYDLRENRQIYADYKEAGVNMLIGGWEDVSLNALDLAAEYELGYLLSPSTSFANIVDFDDPRCAGNREKITAAIEEAKYHKAFCGFNVMDEPGKIHFESIASTQKFLDEQMPSSVKGALWWTNLFPNYANSQQLYGSETLPDELNGVYSYEQYVKDYMEICKPKVLSFDNYGCHVGNKRGSVRSDYFQNLSICRRAALEANIPFWHFVQNCQFNSNCFTPDLAELLWCVNTGLSYGAKGIEYFTGVRAFPDKGFDGAMFDFDGSRTDVYELVKTANTQIAAVDEVLMCSKSMGLMVIGTTPETNKPKKMPNAVIPEEDIIPSYGELASAEAAHALIGCFDYNGKTALYITNNSIKESDTVKLNLSSFKGGYTVQKAVKNYFASTSVEFTLDAGEGVLVVLE